MCWKNERACYAALVPGSASARAMCDRDEGEGEGGKAGTSWVMEEQGLLRWAGAWVQEGTLQACLAGKTSAKGTG